MMTLAQVSSYFDRAPALDAYSGAQLFLCQVGPYDDSKRDAGAAYRRVLSVAPGTPIPGHRCISVHGQTWIVGAKEVDGLEEAHRDKYVLQSGAERTRVSRLGSFLAGTSEHTVCASFEWLKDAAEQDISSKVPQHYQVYLPLGTDARPQDVLWSQGVAFLVLAPRWQPSGFTIAHCLQLEQTLPEPAILEGRTYDPVAGAYTSGAAVSVPALRARWQNLFRYDTQADARFQEGDCSVAVPDSASVSTATRVTLAGQTWKVLAVDRMAGVKVLHARPA